jgi:hypothetical protein
MSGILAYGLQQMEGVRGIRGWRWSVCRFPHVQSTVRLTLFKDLHRRGRHYRRRRHLRHNLHRQVPG